MPAVFAATVSLGAGACTRANPSFGDTGAASTDDGAKPTTGAAGDASPSDAGSGEGDEATTDPSSTSTSTTKPEPVCGDGVVDGDEQCDDGPAGSVRCRPDCVLRDCGDGVVEPPEQCEPGMDPECHADCRLNVCGDELEAGAEQCDDGNESNNDACTNACLDNVCGDGFRHDGVEPCDGNDIPPCLEIGPFGGIANCVACQVVGCTCGNGEFDMGEACEPSVSEYTCIDMNGDVIDTCPNCALEVGACCVEIGQKCGDALGTCCDGVCVENMCTEA